MADYKRPLIVIDGTPRRYLAVNVQYYHGFTIYNEAPVKNIIIHSPANIQVLTPARKWEKFYINTMWIAQRRSGREVMEITTNV